MKYERQKAFTLIEVVIALFLVIMGIAGAFTLIQKVISFVSISSSKLTAAYLSQEGIEIVRNIRDTNWLEQRGESPPAWDYGLSPGNWEADYNTQGLTRQYVVGSFLYIGSNGFYNYSSGTSTPFKRRITIGKPNSDTLEVSVQVQWEERGRTHIITARENLYNW